jgi:hypothetical protein
LLVLLDMEILVLLATVEAVVVLVALVVATLVVLAEPLL